MNTNFSKLRFEVSEALVPDELEALKFLCLGHIPMRKLEAIQDAKAFLEVLEEKGLIEPGNLDFLRELLYWIGRMDLLATHLGSSREQMETELLVRGKAQVSAYRQLLYTITEDLTPEDVRSVKFLLQKKLPKNKLQDKSMFQVLMEMEKNGLIKEDDLTMLKDILKSFRADIKKRIDIYEENKNEPVKRVFKWLQFETVEHMDLEAKEIYRKVKEYSERDHSNMDCFICFIFSHGEKDKIKGVDDEFVNIKELVSCFSESNCPSLAGKPKVFFIQAWQGSVGHPGVPGEADFSGDAETDAIPLTSTRDLADILVAMSTLQGSLFFHSSETGSLYIQYLCDKMELLCPGGTDLETILVTVNKEVGGREFKVWKQMPEEKLKIETQIITTLQKQLIFEFPRGQPSER
ncbi:Caspase-8 [Willisornis vidua]|uniref:Caspase-8 n=1 Tax=Willisornis vidua TaxID=1566151 RepID=A0ABQ9CS20_9PASS|nr:Caspase-8 [Willisornis vidua]